jgi:hypothetical protein
MQAFHAALIQTGKRGTAALILPPTLSIFFSVVKEGALML